MEILFQKKIKYGTAKGPINWWICPPENWSFILKLTKINYVPISLIKNGLFENRDNLEIFDNCDLSFLLDLEFCISISLDSWKKIFSKFHYMLHRDLKSTSHKHFCNRILTIQCIILGHEESKKRCLSSCRNKSSHKNSKDFAKYK